jgi:hypothetical protein
MIVKTKSIGQLFKDHSAYFDEYTNIRFEEWSIVIPPKMRHIMGRDIEVEEKEDYHHPDLYYYKDVDRDWCIRKEWTFPPINEEIDGLFVDILEDL